MSAHGQGKVIMFAAVSMDGYVANEQDEVGPLFDFYGVGGDASASIDGVNEAFSTTPEAADFINTLVSPIGALVIGRRVFDLMNGWGGHAPAGDHVYVVTHQAPTGWEFADTAPFTFVTEGVAAAIKLARETAGDRNISLAAGDLGGNVLRAGLVDRVVMNLVPTVFGTGRPFFGTGGIAEPILFDDPVVAQGQRVTHLAYDLQR
jgi:dihydrofolate reductase